MAFQMKPHFDQSIAVVCRSNQNRSTCAHRRLKQLGYNVSSFGTGQYTILPGPVRNFRFQFGTPYKDIKTMLSKDEMHIDFFKKHKIFQMLDKNAILKSAPERFQETKKEFAIVISLDYQVFMDLLEYFDTRQQQTGDLCYVFNMNVVDQFDAAENGAMEVSEFLKLLENDVDWMSNIDRIIRTFYNKTRLNVMHSLQIY
ncbi:RNA polymerase II subunit A C-terminal domain phosphatase SSU72, putative [Entamoeba invadens IP1]|uniref:RNA polymerase II subunit A C-terminal domain phosphatase SSU72 n=1 Tax=Entamoeba invadens IP1 TaxID=370355 RepID=A0A0A1U2L7_ENTIV|nr:RNA polymerase II subunit A C-terminal domain phosphatase SSU72, putative [Entamoeba invadens IP1]ELP88274.1 RNA polymerase II subunit A C-terminal domain phosphatase SSU72, putative [Entamoeba invadens IP1]|eukprot:XP_004255045.1 RNA polymerase II subunit A C-terminal domain phosphatase SSU72, putative [Entamoeba invadens IP1]